GGSHAIEHAAGVGLLDLPRLAVPVQDHRPFSFGAHGPGVGRRGGGHAGETCCASSGSLRRPDVAVPMLDQSAAGPEPTAQAAVRETAATALSRALWRVGLGTSFHALPFQCSISGWNLPL